MASIIIHPATYDRMLAHDLAAMWSARGYQLTSRPRSIFLHVHPQITPPTTPDHKAHPPTGDNE